MPVEVPGLPEYHFRPHHLASEVSMPFDYETVRYRSLHWTLGGDHRGRIGDRRGNGESLRGAGLKGGR